MLKKRNISTIVIAGIFLLGVGIIIYPWLSDYVNKLHASRAIAGYSDAVSNIDPEEAQRMWKEAVDYNKSLLERPNRLKLSKEEEEEYNKILNVTGTGVMSYVEIPKIHTNMPIYHGTDEAVLQVAIGHLEGTSVPVGGESTHVFITGHRGLPSAKLFTDIDRLEKGDRFYIETLGIRLTYEVDQIKTILPTELSNVRIDKGKDYVTLVTCTPYGINTHRLLVRGKRIHEDGEITPLDEDFLTSFGKK